MAEIRHKSDRITPFPAPGSRVRHKKFSLSPARSIFAPAKRQDI